MPRLDTAASDNRKSVKLTHHGERGEIFSAVAQTSNYVFELLKLSYSSMIMFLIIMREYKSVKKYHVEFL
jgi:hypothetical protein